MQALLSFLTVPSVHCFKLLNILHIWVSHTLSETTKPVKSKIFTMHSSFQTRFWSISSWYQKSFHSYRQQESHNALFCTLHIHTPDTSPLWSAQPWHTTKQKKLDPGQPLSCLYLFSDCWWIQLLVLNSETLIFDFCWFLDNIWEWRLAMVLELLM